MTQPEMPSQRYIIDFMCNPSPDGVGAEMCFSEGDGNRVRVYVRFMDFSDIIRRMNQVAERAQSGVSQGP